jgi:hypothetical protein
LLRVHVYNYLDYINIELLSFCILNNNELFLKFCLRNGIYTAVMLQTPALIDEVLRILQLGAKTELILNVIMYMNLLKWSRVQVKHFLDHLGLMVYENHEKNPITIAYNPILIITLACEQIKFIEESKKFKYLNLFRFHLFETRMQDCEKPHAYFRRQNLRQL